VVNTRKNKIDRKNILKKIAHGCTDERYTSVDQTVSKGKGHKETGQELKVKGLSPSEA